MGALSYIFAGLGNPGSSYSGTRHNAGALFVEALARAEGVPLDQQKYQALTGKGMIRGRLCLLAFPQTYMNRSGISLQRMVSYTNTAIEHLVVTYDDLDLPLGRIRIRRGGGSGGHRGVQSAIDFLQSRDFIRLRIGIGRPPAGREVENYVLSPFGGGERTPFRESLERAVLAAESIVAEGLDKTMSLFNNPDCGATPDAVT